MELFRCSHCTKLHATEADARLCSESHLKSFFDSISAVAPPSISAPKNDRKFWPKDLRLRAPRSSLKRGSQNLDSGPNHFTSDLQREILEELEGTEHIAPDESSDAVSLRTDDLCSALASATSQSDLDHIVSSFLSRVHPTVKPIIEGLESRTPITHNDERSASSINSLYARNCKLCILSLSATDSPKCTLTPEALFAHFQKSNPTLEHETLAHIPYRPVLSDSDMMTIPFTREEISLKISHSKGPLTPGKFFVQVDLTSDLIKRSSHFYKSTCSSRLLTWQGTCATNFQLDQATCASK